MSVASGVIRSDLLARLADAVGSSGLIADASDMAPYLADWRGAYAGRAAAVVRPATTDEVAAVVRACADSRVPIVPQGGNTGMCGGATPDDTGRAIVVSLGRMNRVLDIDPLNNTATVEAGCILAAVQQGAAEVDRLFPLSLAAEGSCQIGGNLSTNAGGINVLRYGNARDLVLGLEAVLPDGTVWSSLRGLRKDNTGYDLKHLFIGAEGTLGIITRAVLKLFPRPANGLTAFAAVPSPAAAVELLALLRARCGESVSAFELISRSCLDMVLRHVSGLRDPLPKSEPWYVLAELGDMREASALREALESALAAGIERKRIGDAAIAENLLQARMFWRLRESIPEAARFEKRVLRSDISVPIGRIADFIATATRSLESTLPGIRIICFGHLGDGNLHFNALLPPGGPAHAESSALDRANRIVSETVLGFAGSISAEHGIGQSKRTELARYKTDVELNLMRTVKAAVDPHNLMNPGKIFYA